MEVALQRSRRVPRRVTRRRIKIADAMAGLVITLGGIGTLAAILGVFVFLLWIVWPLFTAPRALGTQLTAIPWSGGAPARLGVDENVAIGWTIEANGSLRVFRLSDGHVLATQALAGDARVTAWSASLAGSDDLAVGLADGSVKFGHVRFSTRMLEPQAARRFVATHNAESPSAIPYEGGIAEVVEGGQVRIHAVDIRLDRTLAGGNSAVRLVDIDHSSGRPRLAIVHEDGSAEVAIVSPGGDAATAGSATEAAQRLRIDYQQVKSVPPRYVLLSYANVFLAWSDGTLARFAITGRTSRPIETINLLGDHKAELTALIALPGRGTLIAGDSLGRVNGWFLTRSDEIDSLDKSRLTLARELPARAESVTSLSGSARGRIIAAGYADGRVDVFQVTTNERLIDARIEAQVPIGGLCISPKQDAIIACTRTGIAVTRMDLRYPEARMSALFRPVWYEGYKGPEHVWQSSGGSEANEPKYGVMPLVFGTIKATVYSLLFAVPIALLAAIYTSEFLSRPWRARFKPTIELMASLPSVVLGYLAAFVIAPTVARHVPAVLSAFLAIPATFLLAAYVLQLFPDRIALRLKSHRFLLVCLSLPAGIAAAWLSGPWVEQWFFGGNMIRWLDSNEGSAVGGWMILLVPLFAIAVGYLVAREVTPRLRRLTATWSQANCAVADLLKFIVGSGIALAGALLVAWVLSALGFDARGSFVGTYIQRNALIVGFAMGFAIIPLIYTIAEDALSSVPDHLRSASLGAGATRWQTTTRIVVPTAMSGLFSAVMIGLGRAVGETMIVLMAAGNTPIMDWNIFKGFRTLSANLAVELPEAEQGSTHFRVLFLTALALFAITFAVNTVADWVRQRFRRRAYQL
jgi:phosphate transport system permease protein